MTSPPPTVDDIFLLRAFEEPLVPIGAAPTSAENEAVAAAVAAYGHRTAADDFSALTDYLEDYPDSAWSAALWTGLGFECFNSGHYSPALAAWKKAWELGRAATDIRGKALADRAVGELAFMYARLGRVAELEELLPSLRGRPISGPATGRITGATEGLATMRVEPEVAFKCGPYALYSIQRSIDPLNVRFDVIHSAPSTPEGTSLTYLHELAGQLGMKMRMAYRSEPVEFIVASVVHLKLGHYAAITGHRDGRYVLQDPTFGRDIWATRDALEEESSGYFLIPADRLGLGWRQVPESEGGTVWGKGYTCCSDPGPVGPCDPTTDDPSPSCCGGGGGGMAHARVHLMAVSLNIIDNPVGYKPPVGPPIRFTARYGQRDDFQPANRNFSSLGTKWTFDWLSFIQDDPTNANAKVLYYMPGGGLRTFNLNLINQFDHEQYDQTLLTKTANGYQMTFRDGSTATFATSDGSLGSIRRVFLTQFADPAGNTVTLTYDATLRITMVTDAIGQITTLVYGNAVDPFKITAVEDPFGRVAQLGYDTSLRLTSITDAVDNISQFTYDSGDFTTSMTTPYGTTTFTTTTSGDPGPVPPYGPGRVRIVEVTYPDGSTEHVEFNQDNPPGSLTGVPTQDPAPVINL
jgi:YD repeat-containing protein